MSFILDKKTYGKALALEDMFCRAKQRNSFAYIFLKIQKQKL